MELGNFFQDICLEEMQKKIDSMFTKMAAFFPDSHKAEECLHKLNQIKDNSVFQLLEKLLEEQAFTTIGQTMKVWCLVPLKHTIFCISSLNEFFSSMSCLLWPCE